MGRPARDRAERDLCFTPGERHRVVEQMRRVPAFEDPERVPPSGCACPADVGVGVPPSWARIADDVLQGVLHLEAADEVEAGRAVVRLEAGEKDDQVTGLGAAKAEGPAGAPAVVAVSRCR